MKRDALLRCTWPMSWWLVVAGLLVAVLSFGSLVLLSVAAHRGGLLPERQVALFALRERLTAEQNSWADPAWQAAVSAELAHAGVEAELLDAEGRTVFRSPAGGGGARVEGTGQGLTPAFASRVEQRVEIRDQAGTRGTVRFWLPWSPFADGGMTNWDGLTAMLLLFLLAVGVSSLAAVWLLSRLFLSPLRQLAGAAEQVRQGELEFDLPRSRVSEVDGVLRAFGRMAEGLKESIVRQAAMEEERRIFLAAISHDLRTPLFSLRGRLEGLRDGMAQGPDQVQHYLRTALSRVGQLQRLVNGLFLYARLSLLEQSPARDPLDLGALLHETAAGLEPLAEAGQVSLHLKPAVSPCLLVGDGHILGRAVENLIENAIRHTPPGGRVTLAWDDAGDCALIRVEDAGPGLPPEVLADPGRSPQRAEGVPVNPGGGAGLGLHIARRAVEAHGGRLKAANRPEGGGCITMLLPLRPSPQKD